MSSFFTNPIIPGFSPDPSICVVPPPTGSSTPLSKARTSPTTSTSYFLTTSTFTLFPSCAIYHSTDLLNWKLIGHALTRRSQIEMRTPEAGAGSWASTLRYRVEEDGNVGGKTGRWYLCTGVFSRYRPQMDERIFPRGFYVTTTNIWDSSSWSDPIYFDTPGFDQDLFWDDDGRVYLSTTTRTSTRSSGNPAKKDFAIHISEIALPTGRTLTAPTVIRASPSGVAEGSHIVKRGRYYYLFTAEGGTEQGHQEWVFRSAEGVLGPWESRPAGGPLWYNGVEGEVQRTGHVDVFEAGEGGSWWAVLLGVRPVRDADTDAGWLEPQLGRETFLVGVEWVDDWPVFNRGETVGLLTLGPEAAVQRPTERIWKADLARDDLELGWYEKNTPLKKCWSLTDRPGWLCIHGGCYDLRSPEAPTMLLRRQTSFEQSFSVRLDFAPTRVGYEAGLVLWWDMHSFASIGVTLTFDGRRVLKVTTPTDTADAFKEQYLSIQKGSEEAEATTIASTVIPSKSLTKVPPVGQPFLGAMFGVYAFGNGEPCLDAAYFRDICCADLDLHRRFGIGE
ncbi:hypothetical protein LZ554_009472 [Drepanopeziza brunnea f. sp. 'monogermtubi']|nr:hypothetical protein LZ554_009472 [Drepanopeziza brunnea f. sp. 'monogermtubi']